MLRGLGRRPSTHSLVLPVQVDGLFQPPVTAVTRHIADRRQVTHSDMGLHHSCIVVAAAAAS
jgi:hypothetical protein